MRRQRFRRWVRLDVDAMPRETAMPLREKEREGLPFAIGCDNARKLALRPDADGFSMPPDADEDPPLADVFDSYGEDE